MKFPYEKLRTGEVCFGCGHPCRKERAYIFNPKQISKNKEGRLSFKGVDIAFFCSDACSAGFLGAVPSGFAEYISAAERNKRFQVAFGRPYRDADRTSSELALALAEAIYTAEERSRIGNQMELEDLERSVSAPSFREELEGGEKE